MLKVWGRTNSINVQKVLWTLAELDLRYERIDAGMQFGVVDTPEYLARNPNRLIPALDDDGYVLWESNVIVRYLSARYGAAFLYPEDMRERFLAEQWMDWQATNLYVALVPAFLGGGGVPEGAFEEIVDLIREYLGRNTDIQVEYVEEIPLGRTGKRHHSISKIGMDFQQLSQDLGVRTKDQIDT